MMIGEKSARTTALYQTEAFSSTVTSPIRHAVGAMKAVGCTRGDLPSNEKRGMDDSFCGGYPRATTHERGRTCPGAGCSLPLMGAPRIVAVATATPPHRFDQATLLRMAGYDDALRAGFFTNSQIQGRHPYPA